ncbi:uncharacterized protein LOC110813438 [Carica papaya]|uniref:uncharacterized protein LOC110813438 n=1 Tax=Carica papaya TaxID=3649 RepID=UPI000B8C8884|nr:uncharacterized protein LOC110813438 [Carica papaya]
MAIEAESEGGSSPSYYSVLGVDVDSTVEEIRRAYRRLAMRWHPDRWTKTPSLLGKAKRKFQQIQEAYSVLSDPRKRSLYDAGFYDPDEEQDEGFCDFVREMTVLIAQSRKKRKYYSMEEIQSMWMEMAEGFGYDEGSSPLSSFSNSQDSNSCKKRRCDVNVGNARDSGLDMYGTSNYFQL